MFLPVTNLIIAAALSATARPTTAVVPHGVFYVAGDSVPVLTRDVLAKMTTFWTAFAKEPPAIRDTARKQHQKSLTVPLDQAVTGQTSFQYKSVVDMVAMAQKYPSVATDLKNAGLTAQEWEQDRVAVFSACQTSKMGDHAQLIATMSTSTISKNELFIAHHNKEWNALVATDMWNPLRSEGGMDGDADLHP